MEEIINKTLLQIEKDLQDVKSAREQVDIVVESCSQLQEKVDAFVANVAQLSQNADNLIKNVSDRGNGNLDRFKDALTQLEDKCSGLIGSFGDTTRNTVADFESKIADISKTISEKESEALSDFKAALEKLDNSGAYIATLFGTNSEKIISEFENKTSVLSSDLKNVTVQISDSIRVESINLHSEIESLAEIETKMQESVAVINNLNSSIEGLMSELKQSQSAQDDDLEEIKKRLTEQIEQTKDNFATWSKNNSDQYKFVADLLSKISDNQVDNQSNLLKHNEEQENRLLENISAISEKHSSSAHYLSNSVDNVLSVLKQLQSAQDDDLDEIKKNLLEQSERNKDNFATLTQNNSEQYKYISEMLGKISVNQSENQNYLLKNSDKLAQTIAKELDNIKQTQSSIQDRLSNCEQNDKNLSRKIDKLQIFIFVQIVLSLVIAVLLFVLKK